MLPHYVAIWLSLLCHRKLMIKNMKNNIKIISAFTLGAAAGVIITWKFIKTKYERIAQEEIDSVKEVYFKKLDTLDKCKEAYDLKNKLDEEESKKEDKTEDEYTATEDDEEIFEALRNRYTGATYIGEKGGTENMKDYIEVIPPDEYGANGENEEYIDYDLISFTYYADNVLTDDGDFPIDDPEAIVGPDALDSFGEWEDDAVYVRNDDRKCFYEILRDTSNYSDRQVDEE